MRNGKIIWKSETPTFIFASPTLLDMNSDDIEDVLIGSHINTSTELKDFDKCTANFYAFDGRTGHRVWDIQSSNPDPNSNRANSELNSSSITNINANSIQRNSSDPKFIKNATNVSRLEYLCS